MAFIDSNIARKNNLQNMHLKKAGNLPGGSPIFSHIEFNIINFCNRKCIFCPKSNKGYPNDFKAMSHETYCKILKDLQKIKYTGGLSFSGFSEPLLHKDVLKFISSSKEILPDSRIEIITNGDPLNPELIQSLFDAGLNTLLISMYDGPEQILHFEEMISKTNINPEKIILRKRYLSAEEQFGINLSNRAGLVNLKVKGIKVKALEEPMKNPCYYVHYRTMIDYTGDVLLCPHDWIKKTILGNIKKESIVDIWTNENTTKLRKRLGNGDRNFYPCKVCDVMGTRQGEEHFKAWEKFYKK